MVVQGRLRADGAPFLAGGVRLLPSAGGTPVLGSPPCGGFSCSRSSLLALAPAPAGRGRRPGRPALRGGARALARRRRGGGAARARGARRRGQPGGAGAARADRPRAGLPGAVAGAACRRKERLALTRAPGGLSGRSWMAEAAPDTPLAALWVARDGHRHDPGDRARLRRRWARRAPPARPCRRWPRGSTAASPPSPTTRATRPTCATSSGASGPRRRSGRARAAAEIAALMPGDPQIRRFEDRPVGPGRHRRLARRRAAAPRRSGPPARPSARRAPRHLPAAPPTVLVDGHALLAEFGTPSETLIPAGDVEREPARHERAPPRAPGPLPLRLRDGSRRPRRGRLPRRRARRRGRPLLPVTAHAGRKSSATPLMQ